MCSRFYFADVAKSISWICCLTLFRFFYWKVIDDVNSGMVDFFYSFLRCIHLRYTCYEQRMTLFGYMFKCFQCCCFCCCCLHSLFIRINNEVKSFNYSLFRSIVRTKSASRKNSDAWIITPFMVYLNLSSKYWMWVRRHQMCGVCHIFEFGYLRYTLNLWRN